MPPLSAASLMDVEAIGMDGGLFGSILKDLLDQLAATVPKAHRLSSLVRGLVGRETVALGAAILPLHLNFSPNREMLVNR